MTTYYVSVDSGSASAAGTFANAPLLTLQAAADLGQLGDTMIVESSTYTAPSGGTVLTITTSGTAAAPITFEAVPGAIPIIDVPKSASPGINVEASYIVVQGFQVQGDAHSLTLAEADRRGADNATIASGINIGNGSVLATHVQIVDNILSYMPGGGIRSQLADYLTIQNSTVYGSENFSPYGERGISVYAL